MSALRGKADMTVCGSPLSRSLLGVKRTCLCALHMSANDPKRTYRFGIYSLIHTLRESSNKRSAFAIRQRVSVILSRVLRIISKISFSIFMESERYRLKCSIASMMGGSIACSTSQAGAQSVSQPPAPDRRLPMMESGCAFLSGIASVNCGTNGLALCHLVDLVHQRESFSQLILRLRH